MSDLINPPPPDPTGNLLGALGPMGPADDAAPPPMPADEPPERGRLVKRDDPQPEPSRAQLVKDWSGRVSSAKQFFAPAFQKMTEDIAFAAGRQWPGEDTKDPDQNDVDPLGRRYVANLCYRLVQQKVAALYAKNPKFIAKRKPRLDNTVWNGSTQQLQQAAMIAATLGRQQMPVPPAIQAILDDYTKAQTARQSIDRVAHTLELVVDYEVNNQPYNFKSNMKAAVRRSSTTGVGWVKLGYQRKMQTRPETAARIADLSERLATLERMSADVADGEAPPDGSEMEQLRLTLQSLQSEGDQVVQEGLFLDYPLSTAIIPDPKTRSLRGFVGADWVAQEYMLTRDEIVEIYGVDIGAAAAKSDSATTAWRPYMRDGRYRPGDAGGNDSSDDCACVWEIYDRKTQLVYVVCDGYSDFLKDPAAPSVYIERFWPWYVITFNEQENPDSVFPPSDVALVRDMQQEYNRARQGLREHRHAARPMMATPDGALDEEDEEVLRSHPAFAVVSLRGLQPGQKVEDLLQTVKLPGIDPGLYNVQPVFEDIQRVAGAQEANFGAATSGATATETTIAETSRTSILSSAIDDLDDTLTAMAQGMSDILLLEMQEETVKRIVGEGAAWPTLSRQQVADDVFLTIEAGSTGRPNRALKLANFERMAPFILQIPGVRPERLLNYMAGLLDENIDPIDFMDPNLPSIVAMNANAQPSTGDPSTDPNQQKVAGAMNTPGVPPSTQQRALGPNDNEPSPQAFGVASHFAT